MNFKLLWHDKISLTFEIQVKLFHLNYIILFLKVLLLKIVVTLLENKKEVTGFWQNKK